jgi:dissimilatory sulfite reductase (desulfoviridin) alpha/beta subunit
MSDNEIHERLMRLVERRGYVQFKNQVSGRFKAKQLSSLRSIWQR